ncbi:MAG TPA: hypothetical protein VEA99_08840 [Gemmatimonadaceae bacterium]|nr:hypothetical protein [Gemmatimonadaceae bacterium]
MTWRSGRSAVAMLVLLGACDREERPAVATDATRAESLALRIDRDSARLRHDTATMFGLSSEGAFVTASYAGDTLRRVRAELMGETGRVTERFYFDSALALVVRRAERYDGPLSGRVVESTVTRHDLRDGHMPRARRDSLAAEARALIARMKEP